MALSCLVPACRRPPEREAVLRTVVEGVVVGDVRRLAETTRALDAAIGALFEAPDRAREDGARAAFKRALVAWRRAQVFRSGPLTDGHVFVRAMFWPARPADIDATLMGESPIDEGLVERLAANQKGLYALEYVLFERARQGLRPPERAFAREVSKNVLGYAERALRTLGDGRDYAAKFAAGGQDSIAKLAELTTDGVEVLFGKLERVQRRTSDGSLSPADIEGYFSGSSLDVALALLAGAQALFVGAGDGGLGTLVGAISPPVETRARERFASAREKLEALGAPLERAAKEKATALATAAAEVRSLERSLKLEVRSALGLELKLPSGDGD